MVKNLPDFAHFWIGILIAIKKHVVLSLFTVSLNPDSAFIRRVR